MKFIGWGTYLICDFRASDFVHTVYSEEDHCSFSSSLVYHTVIRLSNLIIKYKIFHSWYLDTNSLIVLQKLSGYDKRVIQVGCWTCKTIRMRLDCRPTDMTVGDTMDLFWKNVYQQLPNEGVDWLSFHSVGLGLTERVSQSYLGVLLHTW